MEDRCAAEGGVLPQAYDAESIQALVQDGNVQLPIRLGLKIDREKEGDSHAVWMIPKLLHWNESHDTSCLQFSGWSNSDWDDERAAYVDSTDGVIKAGSFAGPVSQITCMFVGPNVALGKKVKAYYNNNNFGAKSLLTDGDWNVANKLSLNFQGSDNNQVNDVWAAVDLETPHLVNSIMFKSDTRHYPEENFANYADKTYTYCLVGPSIPDPGTAMNTQVKNDNNLVFCEINRGFTTGINTCSCNLILGRFVLLRQRNRLPMSEIAVFGVPFDGIIK